MKNLLLIILLLGCADEPQGSLKGCVTAINKQDQTNTIQYIDCITKEEYLKGGSWVQYYRSPKWKAIPDCGKCSASWR